MQKDFKRDIKIARDQGWRVDFSRDAIVFYSPDGESIVRTHHTNSDHRAIKNFVAHLKRAGLKL